MAASRAVTGNTAKLWIGDAASPTGYLALLELKTFSLAHLDVPQVPTTHLLSPDSTEEFIPGLIKPGTYSFTGNFVGDATQLDILTKAEAQTVFPVKITAPVDKGTKTYTVTAKGYFAKYATGPFEQNKAVEYTGEIQISGTIVENVT